MIGIGLIGFGHWGPNHVRIFNQLAGSRVRVVADSDGQRLEAVRQQFPGTEVVTRFEAVLQHPDVQAVVVATPVATHHSLVKAALQAGKDVLVEKPITYTAAEAQELIDLADGNGRVLMCGHVFLFNAGVRRLRDAGVRVGQLRHHLEGQPRHRAGGREVHLRLDARERAGLLVEKPVDHRDERMVGQALVDQFLVDMFEHLVRGNEAILTIAAPGRPFMCGRARRIIRTV